MPGDMCKSCSLSYVSYSNNAAYIQIQDCRRRYLKLCVLYQIVHGTLVFPNALVESCPLPAVNLRNYSPYLLDRPVAHTNSYFFSFFPDAITHWNTLPLSLQAYVPLSMVLNLNIPNMY